MFQQVCVHRPSPHGRHPVAQHALSFAIEARSKNRPFRSSRYDHQSSLQLLTSSQKKPYSAVTVTIENLTGEGYDEDDFSGIPELVEVIKLQGTGPTEAARAIRKKLKYGNAHRQVRALVILDGLIQNAGPRFQRTFADEPLLERLRVCGTSDLADPDVKKKCRELFRQWSQYAGTPGLNKIAQLHKVSLRSRWPIRNPANRRRNFRKRRRP